MKSQAGGSIALVNYSIFPLKFTTNKCILEMYEKFGYIFQAGIFEVFSAIKSVKYLHHVNAFKIYIKENSFCSFKQCSWCKQVMHTDYVANKLHGIPHQTPVGSANTNFPSF